LVGTVLLFLRGYRLGENRQSYAGQLASCALFASYIQTFILLFTILSTEIQQEHLLKEIALSCRPILYGICLWGIFSIERREPAKDKEIPEKDTVQTSCPEKRTYMTATETYEAYRMLGLTNREAELSILIEQGFSNAEIAAELNISETTVKKHISNIFEKLEVNKREQIKEKLIRFLNC
ncbi:MAG: LuxR C-terminal-related transcriptional regulator, partial [Lachnospiraceae bacterium]|nr:LuxR C-terminal-related transcriptional regulator [Lachnospiraceae bacterium]